MRTGVLLLVIVALSCSRPEPHSRDRSQAEPPPATDHPLVNEARDSIGPRGPLTEADLVVQGLSEDTDSAEVRRMLGAADSVDVESNSPEPGIRLITWRYTNMSIDFFAGSRVAAVELLKPGPHTARGLQVGDSSDYARELYGEPFAENNDSPNTVSWTYMEPRNTMQRVVITIVDRRVHDIWVGAVLD